MIETSDALTWFCFGAFGGLPLVAALWVWNAARVVINEGSVLND